MQSTNRFLQDLHSHRVSLGAWQMFPSPITSRTLSRIPGLSWILVDQEHGNISDSEMHECIANVAPYGVSPLVRIADKERWMVKRALDAGAHGIMVPLLGTVEEVEEVVLQANDNTAVIIQIETLAAYENVEAFAKVPGVDVLFIGPFDLSNSLGHPLAHGTEHPSLTHAIQRILDVAHAHGKKAGIFTTSGEEARRRVEQGFDMVHVGTDVAVLVKGIGEAVGLALGEGVVVKGGGGY